MLTDEQRDRANQAAMGYFWAWIKAMSEGDQFVRPHSRIIDGDRGGIHSVRFEVDGQLLMVVPWDPDYRPRGVSMPARGGVVRNPVRVGETVGMNDADPPPAKLEADESMITEIPTAGT
jgi:hypothetical protein